MYKSILMDMENLSNQRRENVIKVNYHNLHVPKQFLFCVLLASSIAVCIY